MSDTERNRGPSSVTNHMIDCANGLRLVAEKIKCDQPGSDRFLGSLVAGPVLLALGIELALKAWIFVTLGKSDPIRKHDLVILFGMLDSETQSLLEDAWQRGRGGHEILKSPRKMTLKDLIQPRPSTLVEVLDHHRDLFERWRYSHEILMEMASGESDHTIFDGPSRMPFPGVLDRVLAVLVSAYQENTQGRSG